jgi:hypothetical protein
VPIGVRLKLDPPAAGIIVVDNAPEEHCSRYVVETFKGVIYLPEPAAGISRARNRGILRSSGEIVGLPLASRIAISHGRIDIFRKGLDSLLDAWSTLKEANRYVRSGQRRKQPTGHGPAVALKMGRRLRCSSVTYRFRYAPSSRLAGGPV